MAKRVTGLHARTPMLVFRWIVTACQLVTILITWTLWQTHEMPPMLPALPLPALDMGVPLVISLLLVWLVPVPGMVVHTLLVVWAILVDQTRLQPQIISLVVLLWGTLPSPTAAAIARAHLVALWFFAGFHKLVSQEFRDGTAPWMLEGLPAALQLDRIAWLHTPAGYGIALTEMALAILAVVPRTRAAAAILAAIVHGTILIILMPTGHNVNAAVWPWNVALALAGMALILPWQGSPRAAILGCRRVVRPLVVLLIVAPLGFYLGVMDAYLAHHVYSSNTARALMYVAGEEEPEDPILTTLAAFDVPMPPEHRLYRQYFEKTCRAGSTLVISDPRWWYRARGLELQMVPCPAAAP